MQKENDENNAIRCPAQRPEQWTERPLLFDLLLRQRGSEARNAEQWHFPLFFLEGAFITGTESSFFYLSRYPRIKSEDLPSALFSAHVG